MFLSLTGNDPLNRINFTNKEIVNQNTISNVFVIGEEVYQVKFCKTNLTTPKGHIDVRLLLLLSKAKLQKLYS